MTYRGIVSNGVVVLNGEKPVEGTLVEVTKRCRRCWGSTAS